MSPIANIRRTTLSLLTATVLTTALSVAALTAGRAAEPAAGSGTPPTTSGTAGGDVQVVSGQLSDGALFEIRMPEHWNGTLALYSHGLVLPGDDNPVRAAIDPAVGGFLLSQGTALAGAAYGSGWAVEEAEREQLETIDEVSTRFGEPTRVLAYGDSLGGLVSTALAERHPGAIDGALALCGVEAGAVGSWNHFLDTAFVIRTLLGQESGLRLTGIADPLANLGIAQQVVTKADATPAGRARLALAAAIAQLPGAIDADGPVSLPTPEERYAARRAWLDAPFLVLAFAERGEMETRAGGNPSWNTGVDYRHLLRLSGQRGDVLALYRAAGLDLSADLGRLAHAPRVAADPAAVRYLTRHVVLSGRTKRPVLTVRNVADGALPSSHDRAYRDAVRRAGRAMLLRQAFVGRPGHCLMTPAETLAAFSRLEGRIRTGVWGPTSPEALNTAASALGPDLNQGGGFPVPPAFTDHQALRFPRPFVGDR